MGLLDALKGLIGGDAVKGVLESTGLSEHAERLLGDGSAIAENLGVDVGQATEGVTEMLPGGVGDVVQDVAGLPETPAV